MTTPGEPMIRTVDVRVDYGDVTAVDALNLEVAAGEVFGLIGPNGAGKTSTIKVLATLLEPTHGEVYIAGHDPATHAPRARAVLGYMPDLAPVYDDLKCWEFLDQFAGAYGLRGRSRKARVDECLAMVDLTGKRDVMAGTLSRGMTQRLVLAKTMLHRPAVVLLDEPASGLDPIARIALRDLLRALSAEGTTVLVSSHILTELSDFCTSIGIMEKGRMVQSGRIDELSKLASATRELVVELLEPAEGFVAALLGDDFPGGEHLTGVEHEDHTLRIAFAGDERAAAALLSAMVSRGLPVKAFYERKIGVEDLMLRSGAREVS